MDPSLDDDLLFRIGVDRAAAPQGDSVVQIQRERPPRYPLRAAPPLAVPGDAGGWTGSDDER